MTTVIAVPRVRDRHLEKAIQDSRMRRLAQTQSGVRGRLLLQRLSITFAYADVRAMR